MSTDYKRITAAEAREQSGKNLRQRFDGYLEQIDEDLAAAIRRGSAAIEIHKFWEFPREWWEPVEADFRSRGFDVSLAKSKEIPARLMTVLRIEWWRSL